MSLWVGPHILNVVLWFQNLVLLPNLLVQRYPGISVKDALATDLGITCLVILFVLIVDLYKVSQIFKTSPSLLTSVKKLTRGFFTLMRGALVGCVMSLKLIRTHGVLFTLRQKVFSRGDEAISSPEKMSMKYSDL